MLNLASFRGILGVSGAVLAASLSSGAVAQSLPVNTPRPAATTQPPAQLPAETVETTTGPDGVETITRTRRIPARAGTEQTQVYRNTQYPGAGYQAYPPQGYAPAPSPAAVVVGREQWINECRRRTAGRSDKDRNQVIGGLLGATVGGLAGNRIANGERLAGTLIGAGAGGVAGAAIGNTIDGDDEDRAYDCEAALENYLSQYSAHAGRIAARTIPASSPYISYAPQSYNPYQAPVYQGYGYPQPSQVVWVPIEVEQQQRVVVRETVREEGLAGRRIIPAPQRVQVPANSKPVRE
ncbi:glycine zipper 2TM domain-containing protein [Erythrobacter sp. YT30]|uniref:glycine zipper 2TM domain-containing protein n=1 Tax=Erythrobacter sp. YT30 TaxID=1735012 RepID=UPI00076C6FB7|nr:glycine zipper 2TM domain-containing protein [Erythrobacter sp. YT30]KWV91405.1 hypothetical protein AUC45_09060 [Erythrobacter sp. YT30]